MFIGILLLSTLLLEVFVLTYLEYISWKTLYTPLTCLMLPYLLVLLITLGAAGHNHLVSFYYPSLFVWNIGLALFAIPSFILSLATKKYPLFFQKGIKETNYSKMLGLVSILIILAFSIRFVHVLHTTTELFGTDEFAEEFCGHGLWAHLRSFIVPLLIIAIYHVSKKRWWLWGIIIALLLIQLLYMVKGAIIISVVAGLFIRLYAGKTHLSISLITKSFIGAFSVFLLVYMVLPLLGKQEGIGNIELLELVSGHFLHYLTSGTLGYSYDLQIGCPDKAGFEILVSPFVNLYHVLTGSQEELLSPVNPYYHFTGISYTNVRTFFGTMHIYCNPWQFVLYTLVASTVLNLIQLMARAKGDVFIYAILCYFCGLMAMGWFEFYLFHLAIIEVPLITLLLMALAHWENDFNLRIHHEHTTKLTV